MLPNDRTHALKAFASRRMRRDLTMGAVLSATSGTPLTDYGKLSPDPITQYFMSKRGAAGRTPFTWNANVRATYSRSRLTRRGLARGRRPAARFSQRKPILVDEFRYLATDAKGNPTTPNPFYHSGFKFQPPNDDAYRPGVRHAVAVGPWKDAMNPDPAARRGGRRWSPTIVVTLAVLVVTLGAGGWWRWRQTSGTQPRGGITLAVTPFRAVGAGVPPWSGTGLAAEVRDALDAVSGISARLAGRAEKPAADYLVGGTIGREGTRTAIAIEVVRRMDQAVLWAGTYWRGDADLASLSGDLAQAVALSVRTDAARNKRR